MKNVIRNTSTYIHIHIVRHKRHCIHQRDRGRLARNSKVFGSGSIRQRVVFAAPRSASQAPNTCKRRQTGATTSRQAKLKGKICSSSSSVKKKAGKKVKLRFRFFFVDA